ncbi:MAG: hypothetical protein ACTHL8_10975 [Burkholderiaceae bacterium]
MKPVSLRSRRAPALGAILAIACLAQLEPARAQSSDHLSEASGVSVAVSVALPVMFVAGVGSVVVTAVQATGDGIVWVVENVADGARASVRVTGHAIGASAVAVGTVLTMTATSAGLLLSAAGQVVAFIPNEVGRALLYDRQVSQ